MNIVAVVVSGILAVEGRFTTETPLWVILLCANSISFGVFIPLATVVTYTLSLFKVGAGNVEQEHIL
ncbi:MAG: hypothetical protein HQL32_02650 [Planctomycetes bacterium]|nr:hypothetical protein [Planctomycetota bacterium]